MADRRSVFTDARIVQKARSFVCVADEVWRLQRGSEADCVFFQKMVNGGERITDRGTRQGTWVLSPAGSVLARVNTRNVEKVLEVLDSGLAAWNELEPKDRQLPAGVSLAPEHRWEASYPDDGLVLERFARDLGPGGLDGPVLPRWNRDFAWFSAGEIESQLPSEVVLGTSFALPLVAERLARFHLVDNVRGQSLPFAPEEVEHASLTANAIGRVGDTIVFALRGETRAVAKGPWILGHNLWKPKGEWPRGIETRLTGRVNVNARTRRITDFELVAAARRWGRTAANGRKNDELASRIAFHLGIAKDAPRVAPTFIALYDAPWVKEPAVATWLDSPEECGLSAGD